MDFFNKTWRQNRLQLPTTEDDWMDVFVYVCDRMTLYKESSSPCWHHSKMHISGVEQEQHGAYERADQHGCESRGK